MENQKIAFKSWSKLMFETHGWNGSMAVAYTSSVLFYDLIIRKLQFFPLLNLYGPPASGKSYLAGSVMALFDPERKQYPLNLSGSTPSSIKEWLNQTSSCLLWGDEFSPAVHCNGAIDILKNMYYGSGEFSRAAMYIGYQRPTQDVALLTRSISLGLSGYRSSTNELKRLEKMGQLSGVISELLPYERWIATTFLARYDVTLETIYRMIKIRGYKIKESRIINNYAVPMAIVNILAKYVEFGFSINEFEEFCLRCIAHQCSAIEYANE